MSRKISKSQRALKKTKQKQKHHKKIENLHAKGLTKNHKKITIEPKTLFIIKISICLTTILVYFFFSKYLIFCFLALATSSIMAHYCEKTVNKSFIKRNQIKFSFVDSILSVILILISVVATAFGLRTGGPRRFGKFSNTWIGKLTDGLRNIGTLLTGQRSLFRRRFSFSPSQLPPDFPNMADFENMPNMGNMPGRPPMMKPPTIDDLPLEFLFANILSTIMTVLIFTTLAISLFSVYSSYKKLKKLEEVNNDFIEDDKIKILSDEEISKVLSFGIDYEE